MSIHDVDRALRLMEAYPDKSHFVGPRDPALIARAESALGVRFPPSYRRFLQELGEGAFGGQEFFGARSADFESGSQNAIWLTRGLRTDLSLPHHFVVVSDDGSEETYCIDTSSPDETGECPIVVWLMWSDPGDELEILAPDFGSFFLERVQREIKWIQEGDEEFEALGDILPPRRKLP